MMLIKQIKTYDYSMDCFNHMQDFDDHRKLQMQQDDERQKQKSRLH